MKLFIETIHLTGLVPVHKTYDGLVSVTLSSNGTFLLLSADEARALADKLRAAADQREVA